ncbi:C6 zinc finger domain-containing protein [Sarocladium implicatum]|nr:C6 zinc finger domain-containing protein [Sarocladium implicatum]
MIRSFALGRLAYLGLAITISLLVGTVWFTGGVSGDSINIPYCTFQEQRPCPAPPPPAAAVCPTQPPTTSLKNSTEPATSKLHYLLPASKSTEGVCVGITSALLNRYPPPTLLGWKAKGDFDAKGNHIAKLLGISRYLHNVKDAADDDLVIVVDAFDVIAQTPAEATIQLYFDLIGAANERLAAQHGMTAEEARALGLYQSLLWGAEKGCFPPRFHEPQCWLVPESDAAHNQWGPKAITGEEPWRFPKALNSGAVIGPLCELRDFIDATIVLVDETRDPEAPYANSDQLYIARLYARQEYHRNLDLLPRDKRYPGIDEGKGRTLPEPRVNDSDVTEYHVTVDFEYAFAQHHCYNERFMHKLKYNNWDYTTTISKDHMEEGSGFKPFKIQLPGYLARSLARIWESIPQDDKPTSTSREWVQNLRLNTNVATQKVKRRVKCDEGRPVCNRCKLGDRQCAYVEPPIGTYTWHHLLRAGEVIPPRPTIRLPQKYARGLDYFRLVVAPVLGGQLGSTFWTESVMQLVVNEEAAMHGMLAISMLYEGFEPKWRKDQDDDVALQHYNYALRLVATSRLQDEVVLVASVLFICIEFLRGNIVAAVTHCRHGILMSKSVAAHNDSVAALLRHLSTFPYFFCSAGVPLLVSGPCRYPFESVSNAAFEMDELMGRAIRLVRSLDGYRLGGDDVSVSQETRYAQHELLVDLQAWKTAFEDYSLRSTGCDNGMSLLLMRFLVCWIWVNVAAERDETAGDVFQPDFARLVKLSSTSAENAPKSRFTFDMGMTPLLHFVVLKCRHLSIRLEALEAIRALGNSRESLWDTTVMYAVGRCIIEKEHAYVVGSEMAVGVGDYPANESRVLDSYVEEEVFEQLDENGMTVLKRKIWLFVREEGVVTKIPRWISSVPIS